MPLFVVEPMGPCAKYLRRVIGHGIFNLVIVLVEPVLVVFVVAEMAFLVFPPSCVQKIVVVAFRTPSPFHRDNRIIFVGQPSEVDVQDIRSVEAQYVPSVQMFFLEGWLSGEGGLGGVSFVRRPVQPQGNPVAGLVCFGATPGVLPKGCRVIGVKPNAGR